MRIYRKVCASLVLVGLSALPAVAQSTQDPRGGIEIGAGATYLTVPNGTSRSKSLGLMAGAFAVVPLTSMFKLQPEIHYEYRKSKAADSERTFGYISIPILARMSLFKGLYIIEGPAFHVPVSATVAGQDVKSNTRSPDVSIVIGVGKRVGKMGLEARWDSGIRQVQKTVGRGDVPTRHRSISAVIAIPL